MAGRREPAEQGLRGAGGADRVGAGGVEVGDAAAAEEVEDELGGFGGLELGLGGVGAEGGGAEEEVGAGEGR